MFNIGIVGLGNNGMMHLRGFTRLKESRVAAICDLRADLADQALKIIGDTSTFVTDDYKKLCAMKELDAVCICTPTYTHIPIALEAIKQGKDLFLEKPVATNMKDMDKLIVKAFAADRIVQIGLVYRYSNLYRTMAAMVERGSFGNVMMAYCKEYRDNFPTQWFFETEKSGGALLDKNCHHFDLFNWFIRSRPHKVYAMGGQHVVKGDAIKVNCSYAPDPELIIQKPDIIDHAYVLVQYENTAVANLGLCMYQKQPQEGLEIGIIGDNGAHSLAKTDVILTAGGGPLGTMREIPVDYFSDNNGIGHIGSDVQHIEFLRCLKNRTLPFANLLLCRDSMVVSLAAEQSIREGREVLMSEYANPAVDKLYAKYAPQFPQKSPNPLPPPRRKKVKTPSREEKILNTVIDLVRMLSGKRTLNEVPPFEPALFKNIADISNKDAKYLAAAKGLNILVKFEHPGQPPVMIKFSDGKMEALTEIWGKEDAKIIFTADGWNKLQSGDSPQKLYLLNLVKFEGNMDRLAPYAEAFIMVAKRLQG